METRECTVHLNPGGEEDVLEVCGYKRHWGKLILTLCGVVMTGGLLGLLLYWVERYWLYATCQRCRLAEATSVHIVDYYKDITTTHYVKQVKIITHHEADILVPVQGSTEFKAVSEIRFFNAKKRKYIWDPDNLSFFQVRGLDQNIKLQQLHQYVRGLDEADSTRRRNLFNENEIKVPVNSVFVLLIKEILSPFYVFQVFSVCFWYADNYWLYATAIVVTSCVSLSAALYNTRTNQLNLRDTIVSSEAVTVLRPDDTKVLVMSIDLVPGDVIEIPDHGCQMHCDAVLLEGQAIMNESMLTGESVPITKTSCLKEDVLYNNKEHEKHTLKCGTQVIQTRKYKGQTVRAVVIRTGYLTTKGDLVRSILYPHPEDFQFESDSYKFIVSLALIATIGMIYTLVKMVEDDESVSEIILEVFDLITIVVPPALPAAMTIGVVIAQQRLRQKNIFCISPRNINVAGSIDCVCFDKTGTITEDGMDMWGVIPSTTGLESYLEHETAGVAQFSQPSQRVSELKIDSRLLIGMAVCQELNVIGGKIMGDPLDEKVFESTKWSLEQDGEEENQVDRLVMPYVKSPVFADNSVLQAAPQRLMQFSSENQCMSVICRVFQEQLQGGFTQPQCMIYCKGSPEKIMKICRKESIPEDFSVLLDRYATYGFRIIAMAYRNIPSNMAKTAKINKMTRAEIESDLTFLGLIVLENRIKPVSAAIFKELHGANIRPIMVTGDNILTAVSVSRNCGLVPPSDSLIKVVATVENGKPSFQYHHLTQNNELEHDQKLEKSIDIEGLYQFALDGSTFEILAAHHHADLFLHIVRRGAVFARMRPNMKQKLVEALQDMDYYVGMCGDGANDCGALKAAHSGISLSEAEASVASPFTSKTPDISCVPVLIKEGRAALVTSFGIFKYMAAYSITQFVSVMILYDIYSNLSDTQFLYIDLFIITSLATLFGLNQAYSGPLGNKPPENSLISVLPLFSLLSQMAIAIAAQVVALYVTKSQPWFVPFQYDNPCYGGTDAFDNFNRTGLLGLDKCSTDHDPVASYENYAIFAVSQFQYIILAIAFAKGSPYRKNIFHNVYLMLVILSLTAFSIYLTLGPSRVFVTGFIVGFELFLPPIEYFGFRCILIGIVLGNFFISILCESLVADILVKMLLKKKNTVYELLDKDLRARSNWPPVSEMPSTHSPETVRDSPNKNDVVITGKGVSDASDAFDSLFSTPVSISHSTAAVALNPLLKKDTPPNSINLKSSTDSTPQKKALAESTVSTPGLTTSSDSTGKYVSCDSILGEGDIFKIESNR